MTGEIRIDYTIPPRVVTVVELRYDDSDECYVRRLDEDGSNDD